MCEANAARVEEDHSMPWPWKVRISSLILGKQISLQTYGKGKYKRTIADVILPDGLNVNPGLVKECWC